MPGARIDVSNQLLPSVRYTIKYRACKPNISDVLQRLSDYRCHHFRRIVVQIEAMNPATNRRPDFILVQSGPVPQQTVPQPTVPQPTVLQHVATAPVQPATPIPVQPGVAPGTQIYIVSEQYPTGISLRE